MGDVGAAVEVLGRARRILAFTGAGCSTESGIPDFRGPDGLWTKVDPDDFTIDRFLTSRDLRVRSWEMHRRGEMWGARSTVAPNAAHLVLADMWDSGRLTGIVTQNIDGLHQAAGVPDHGVAELHGSVRSAICVSCGRTWPTEEVLGWVDAGQTDPTCPSCERVVKTTTVMFGELLPTGAMNRAQDMADAADAVLVVGSTMSVYPAVDIPLSAVRRGAPLVIVNRGRTDHDHRATVKLDAGAGETLTAIAAAL